MSPGPDQEVDVMSVDDDDGLPVQTSQTGVKAAGTASELVLGAVDLAGM